MPLPLYLIFAEPVNVKPEKHTKINAANTLAARYLNSFFRLTVKAFPPYVRKAAFRVIISAARTEKFPRMCVGRKKTANFLFRELIITEEYAFVNRQSNDKNGKCNEVF